ncbi:hypothetical protein ACH4UM_13300 [Streptomyces sp. NPDC020801]|uniref:hypothetical protein n=1 Tax=unclassified Streptomyces TaxID=2593676 RepID=UPI0037891D94
MRTARTPSAVLLAAVAAVGLAAPAAVAKGSGSPGASSDVAPGAGGPGAGGPGADQQGGFDPGTGNGTGNGVGRELEGQSSSGGNVSGTEPYSGVEGARGGGFDEQLPGATGDRQDSDLGFGGPREGSRSGSGPAPSIVVRPSVITRGGQLSVTVEGCRDGSTMDSSVFPKTPLRPVNQAGETARGSATIHPDARPGTYTIRVVCNGRPLVRPAAFTVIGGVQGGLGGGTTTGATPTDMAIGGGLMATGVVGGGVFWMRRRTHKRL